MSLHSAHNPAREADRYADAQGFPYRPLYIVVTEPGESYLASSFRVRYPDARLVALRYTESEFSKSDALWDRVWRPGTGVSCSAFLFGLIADEHLPLASFVPWKPSDARWPDIARSVWESIGSLYAVQKSIMHTRSHFGRRWLANALSNASRAVTVVDFAIPPKPVLLALSGPSLERLFPFDASRFFVCAVSSALSCMLERGVEPDLCLSTDGGYWAKRLFSGIPAHVPVAFPLEAAIPQTVLESNDSAILDYGSALEADLLSVTGIRARRAERNGTVAGTAAKFFVDHTESPVYAAGLDLCVSASFTHARPHPSVAEAEASDGRFRPLCGELFARGAESASLGTYASWFSSRDASFTSRFFRLGPVATNIDGIETVSLGDVDAGAGFGNGDTDPAKYSRRAQRIGDSARRADAIRSYVGRFRERAERCLRAPSFEAKAALFASDLDVGAGRDMLQMISYTGYVNCLKASRRADALEAERASIEAIDRLCADARDACVALAEKAAKAAID